MVLVAVKRAAHRKSGFGTVDAEANMTLLQYIIKLISQYTSSLIGVVFFAIIETGLAIAAYQIWKCHAVQIQPLYKVLTCTVVCLGLIILTGLVLLSSHSKPSTVDITPLEELDEIDIANVSQRIHKLSHLPFERYNEETILSEREDNIKEIISMSYRTHKNDGRLDATVSIKISRFESRKWADEHLLFWRGIIRQKHVFIDLPNGIDIVKRNSWMERNADTYYTASNRRLIYTYIVINEYFFQFEESSYSAESRGKSTSECISMICEALKDR